MTEHLSTEIVERFHQQALAAGDRDVIYNHVLKCEGCRERIVDSLSEPIALQALSDHLVSSSYDDPCHLDYELVQGYVEDNLDRVDRETAEMHLGVCSECSAEVTDLRESLATMRAASVPPHLEHKAFREGLLGLTRLPAFANLLRVVAVVALVAFAVIAVVIVWRLKSGTTQEPASRKDLTVELKPTPTQSSTPVPGSGNLPLPKPGPSAGSLAGSASSKKSNKSPEVILALNDGPSKVTLDKSGKLRGLEFLPRESQEAVKNALLAQAIQKPDVLGDFARDEVLLRAPIGNEDSARVVYPVSAVIVEDRPLFEWVPAKTARAYRVEVGDANFHQAAKIEELPAPRTTWTPPSALKRGMVYTWIVRVIKDGAEGGSVSSASQGKFKILEDEKVRELNRLKATSRSHLALGVFYAREGMIAEAEREFQALVKENPRSPLAKKLLKEIQSWQSR